jgi:hypothetical protein
LLALEKNWQGSLHTNQNIEPTLTHFQNLEKSLRPADLRNWRVQQALLRAYYDAYTRRRLLFETELEQRAMQLLRTAPKAGAEPSLTAAEKVLAKSATGSPFEPLRTRIFELGEALFQSIGMQLSVEKYKAIAVDRGACLDTLDFPLNNRVWLVEQFARIRKLPSEMEQLQSITSILSWSDPGPGGFYDDLGNPASQPHLVRKLAFEQDPGAMQSPRSDFEEDLVVDEPDEKSGQARRLSWVDHAEALYDAPLQMRYTGLDTHASYKLRVIYGGDSFKRNIRLVAGSDIEIHPYITKPRPITPLEFVLPPAAIEQGELLLSWFAEPGLGGNGRACQVSEVWLLRQ